MNTYSLNDMSNLLLDDKIKSCIRTGNYANEGKEKLETLIQIYRVNFAYTGLEDFFKFLDDYGEKIKDTDYTNKIINTIACDENYNSVSSECIPDALKTLISNEIPPTSLETAYRIYNQYKNLIHEFKIHQSKRNIDKSTNFENNANVWNVQEHNSKDDNSITEDHKENYNTDTLTHQGVTVSDANIPEKQETKKSDFILKQNISYYDDVEYNNFFDKIDVLVKDPNNITNHITAFSDLINNFFFTSYVMGESTNLKYQNKFEEYCEFANEMLKKFNVDLNLRDICTIKKGTINEYTTEQVFTANRILNLPLDNEPHFSLYKFLSVEQAFLDTFDKYNYNSDLQAQVVSSALQGNFECITNENNGRLLLTELGNDEIKKIILERQIMGVPAFMADTDAMLKDLKDDQAAIVEGYINDLTHNQTTTNFYDLDLLEKLNKIASYDTLDLTNKNEISTGHVK